MKTTSATQTSTKPAHRAAGISSRNHSTPSRNCRIGARYCSSPSVVIETRVAAAPKQMSGTAVMMPAVVNSSAWPTPCCPTSALPASPMSSR